MNCLYLLIFSCEADLVVGGLHLTTGCMDGAAVLAKGTLKARVDTAAAWVVDGTTETWMEVEAG